MNITGYLNRDIPGYAMNKTLYNNLDSHMNSLNMSAEANETVASNQYNDMAVIVESDKDTFWDHESNLSLPSTGKAIRVAKSIRSQTKEKLTRNRIYSSGLLVDPIASNTSLRTDTYGNSNKNPRYIGDPRSEYSTNNQMRASKPSSMTTVYKNIHRDVGKIG